MKCRSKLPESSSTVTPTATETGGGSSVAMTTEPVPTNGSYNEPIKEERQIGGDTGCGKYCSIVFRVYQITLGR